MKQIFVDSGSPYRGTNQMPKPQTTPPPPPPPPPIWPYVSPLSQNLFFPRVYMIFQVFKYFYRLLENMETSPTRFDEMQVHMERVWR